MPRSRVGQTVSVQLCQTLASQVWCKLATCTWACSVSPDGWTGGWRHTQAQSIPNPLPWFSSCQRHAASVSLAAFHLFRCQWAGNSHSCTLLDIAGWQPLGLLLHDWWVKSGSCLQQHRGIWDTSPALGCKHIHLSAVVTRMIKRGKVERDKMPVESQLDEKGKKDQKGAWLMDLHAGQGIHTLRIPLTYPCPLPILRHIEVGLDWFMPRAHWHWASSDKEAYTDMCYLAITPSLTFSTEVWTGMGSRLANFGLMSPFLPHLFAVPCTPEVTTASDEQSKLLQQVMKWKLYSHWKLLLTHI